MPSSDASIGDLLELERGEGKSLSPAKLPPPIILDSVAPVRSGAMRDCCMLGVLHQGVELSDGEREGQLELSAWRVLNTNPRLRFPAASA